MFETKGTITKYAGYFLIAFFLMIIILSFGLPDLGLNCGEDPYMKIQINGQKFNPVEYYKYQRMVMGSAPRNEQMSEYFYQSFVREVLIQQKAEHEGIEFSDQRLSDIIKKRPEYTNPSTGKFDPAYFQMMLNANNMTLPEFEKIFRRNAASDELYFYIGRGNAVSSDELKFSSFVSATKIQIKYAFLSNDVLKKRYEKDVTVTDAEIDSEIESRNVKISDPNTDRERIRKQLADKKLDKLKNDIIEKINSLASSNASFDTAAAILNGTTGKSAPFKIGEEIRSEGKEPVNLGAISGSGIFTDRLLVMGNNVTSPVINSASGLYIFTPVLKELPASVTDETALDKTRGELTTTGFNTVIRNMLLDMLQGSKIIKSSKN
ncbi:MAG TPA: SurA N-terminal domain-containing protein [Spirochaetota bacterium]|mgnify:CR=1 FL=1|nr:SurA N-terminal domain-containing protein [Spirochaetota bacterium]